MARTFTEAEVTAVLDEIWKGHVAFPLSKICKHLAACHVLDHMERLGLEMPPADIVGAIVRAEDEVALAWDRP